MGLQTCAAVFSVACALGGGPADCQTWHFEPGVYVQETLTNNVNLVPSNLATADLVTEITPVLHITEKGARSSLAGSIGIQGLVYARTGAENNQIYPLANLLGNVEVLDKLFYVEGAVVASQQFFNPFGAQPINIANATSNRYSSVLYRVSPYLQGVATGGITYLLRNNSSWANLDGTPIATNTS